MTDIHNILAIHGSASSGKQWRSLQALAAPHAQCIAPTMPDADAKTRFTHLKDAILNVDHIHVVAHSFGASLAMKLANDCPDKVSSLTLYDPVVRLQNGPANDLEKVCDEMLWHGPATGMATFLDFWAGAGAWAATSDRRRASLIAKYGSVLNDFGQMAVGDWVPSRIAYSGPLTILSGHKSPPVIQQTTGHLNKTYAQAQAHVLPGFDHMTPLTHPELMDQILIEHVMDHAANMQTAIAA